MGLAFWRKMARCPDVNLKFPGCPGVNLNNPGPLANAQNFPVMAALHLLNADEMLDIGLGVLKAETNQLARRDLRLARFRSLYGSNPIVYSEIWEKFQTTTTEAAHIEKKNLVTKYFFMTLYFLKSYPTEHNLATFFGVDEKTVRRWTNFYILKIQALKWETIIWNLDDSDKDFIISIDGIHCSIEEPKHATKTLDPKYYSHKTNKAGLAYEIALSLYEPKLVSIQGPFPAATSDLSIFQNGIMRLIPAGKKVIADQGYNGEPHVVSTRNFLDSKQIREFKSRARARHETFNGRLKAFCILKNFFRHKLEKHGPVFEAICVIVQYQLDHGGKLFDVYK